MHCNVLYCIVLHCIVLNRIVLYSIVSYCIALYCSVFYCIVFYFILLYCQIRFLIFFCYLRSSLNCHNFPDSIIIIFCFSIFIFISHFSFSIFLFSLFSVLEKVRSKVYGSWAALPSTTSVTTSFSAPSSSGRNVDQKACVCCLAGPSGSGKRTLMQAIAFDLGR